MGWGRRAVQAADEQRNGQGGAFAVPLTSLLPGHAGEGLNERRCWPAWLEPWLCLFPAVRPQASFLSSSWSSVSTSCKVGVITALAHHRTCLEGCMSRRTWRFAAGPGERSSVLAISSQSSPPETASVTDPFAGSRQGPALLVGTRERPAAASRRTKA